MKINHKFKAAILVAILGTLSLGMAGCGDSRPGPDEKTEKARLDEMLAARAIFEKVNGDWNQLTATDKAAYVKTFGDETKAQNAWMQMKNGPVPPGGSGNPAAGG